MASQDIGIEWEQDNIRGHYYYIHPNTQPALPDVKSIGEAVGVFVPEGEYRPVVLDHYTSAGTMKLPDGRTIDAMITCNRPLEFWPPIRPGQHVPEAFRNGAKLALADFRKRMVYLAKADPYGRDFVVTPVQGRKKPKSLADPSYSPPLGRFKGKKKPSESGTIPNAFPYPDKVQHEGQTGSWFEVHFPSYTNTIQPGTTVFDGVNYEWIEWTSEVRPKTKRIFVPFTPDYCSIEVRPDESKQKVIATDGAQITVDAPNRLFNFWPPRLPGQRVAPELLHRANPGRHIPMVARTELVDEDGTAGAVTPRVAELRADSYPYPIVQGGVAGHMQLIQWPVLKVPLDGGTVRANGKKRPYLEQTVLLKLKPSIKFIPYSQVYLPLKGIRPLKGTKARCIVTLRPLRSELAVGEPLSVVMEFPVPKEVTFNFYPVPVEGQTGQEQYPRSHPSNYSRVEIVNKKGEILSRGMMDRNQSYEKKDVDARRKEKGIKPDLNLFPQYVGQASHDRAIRRNYLNTWQPAEELGPDAPPQIASSQGAVYFQPDEVVAFARRPTPALPDFDDNIFNAETSSICSSSSSQGSDCYQSRRAGSVISYESVDDDEGCSIGTLAGNVGRRLASLCDGQPRIPETIPMEDLTALSSDTPLEQWSPEPELRPHQVAGRAIRRTANRARNAVAHSPVCRGCPDCTIL